MRSDSVCDAGMTGGCFHRDAVAHSVTALRREQRSMCCDAVKYLHQLLLDN